MAAKKVDALLVGSHSRGQYDLIDAVCAFRARGSEDDFGRRFYTPKRRMTFDDKTFDLYISFLGASYPQDTYRSGQLLWDSSPNCHYPDGVMLVYDATNKQSFQELPEWVDLLQSFNSKKTRQLLPILLLATRADHPKRVISYTEGRDFAASRNLTLVEINTTRPPQNVEYSLVLFLTMIQKSEAKLERGREITNEIEDDPEDDTESVTDDSGPSAEGGCFPLHCILCPRKE